MKPGLSGFTSVRARDAFLTELEGHAAILPRIVALGDLDEDEIIFADAATAELAEDTLAFPPAIRPLDRRLLLAQLIVRWAAAITLMWASIEKWAYPQWSFPLIKDNPAMTLGYDAEFFMQAAGVIEFTLAFALIWTPLVRRASAIALAAAFIGAIAQFGKLDAIGHALIIVVLVAIAADNVRAPEQQQQQGWNSLLAPAAYCVALAAFMAIYYLSHAAIFGSTLG